VTAVVPSAEAQARRELAQQVTLVELLDRILDKGVVISGEITLAVAGIDLVEVGLQALIASVDRLERMRPDTADD
jgi:gas vesicle structural protein